MPPRKKKEIKQVKPNINAFIAGAGLTVEQPITETLETNYMPYAMSVIVSRAIPEIDGFKPSHRKLLYTMYNMGLLNGNTMATPLFMKRWCVYRKVIRHCCILMCSRKAHLVKRIQEIWLMLLRVILKRS